MLEFDPFDAVWSILDTYVAEAFDAHFSLS